MSVRGRLGLRGIEVKLQLLVKVLRFGMKGGFFCWGIRFRVVSFGKPLFGFRAALQPTSVS